MDREDVKNWVSIIGTVVSGFELNHSAYGENFYKGTLSVMRLSNTVDMIPVIVSDRSLDMSVDYTGQILKVTGQLRQYNRRQGNRARCVLSVFAFDVVSAEEQSGYETNQIFLDGYICKEPVYRKTPLGREITDIMIAVNREYGKSDYLPCIAWGRNARYASSLDVGTRIRVEGRFQSREYLKRFSETETETRMAYEVSLSKMELVQ